MAPTTVVPTTAAPTTEAPITTVAPTTTVDEDAVPAPIGLIYAGNKTLPYYFAWQSPASDIDSYNVYVDGRLVATSNVPHINLSIDVFKDGKKDYIISVKSVRGGKESEAISVTYSFNDELLTTEVPTTVAPTTVVPTTVAPTTVVPTTVAPTTVAPTTVVPTTVAPTTVAPTTVAPTTVVPTTVAPTTEAPTTVAPTTVDEEAVPTPIGLTYVGNETLPYYFIWQAPASDIDSYNVYVDGRLVATSNVPNISLPIDVFKDGKKDYTISVKSVRDGRESEATSVTYSFKDELPTTEAPTTEAPTTQSETSTAIIGEGSDAGKVDSEILNCKNDKDLAGSTFGKLCVKVKKSKKKAISLTWKKISTAKTYVVYGTKCGTSYKKIATVHSKTFTNKKLRKGTYYKYMVVALNEKNEVVAISKLIHVATKGGKVGNCKKLKVNKSKVNLKQGRKFKLKVKQIAESKKVKVKKHRKIAFESDNQDVAVVSKKGVITAKKKGKCSVYVYAQNGVYKQVKVTVK